MSEHHDLFQATTVGSISVKNRIFMAPLTRNRAQDDTDVPHQLAIPYYTQRASAGLIITEATQISPIGKGYIRTPGIYTVQQREIWQDITRSVHKAGGKIICQLWHVGRISHGAVLPEGEQPVAPSAIRANAQTFIDGEMVDVAEPRAMTKDDIQMTIEDYRTACEHAKAAGFDGVEIHAANGYLIDQFLRDSSNQREDEYGGSIENRLRFLQEVVEAVTAVWEPGRVGIRLSPTGNFNDIADSDPLATFSAVIDMLNPLGLAYMHMVEKFPGMDVEDEDTRIQQALIDKWQGFYIANGDYDRERAIEAIANGHAHAITFGRLYIANPDLAERLQQNAALNEPDQATFYGGGAEGYTDYPFLAEQAETEAAE